MTRLSIVEVLAGGPRESGSRGTWGQGSFRNLFEPGHFEELVGGFPVCSVVPVILSVKSGPVGFWGIVGASVATLGVRRSGDQQDLGKFVMRWLEVTGGKGVGSESGAAAARI